MQSAIVSLQSDLRRLFRTYVVDGDPYSGLNEPNIQHIRQVLGEQLPGILARALIGPVGSGYPAFPNAGELDGNLFFLNAAEGRWETIAATAVQDAADLINFSGEIEDAINAATQAIIDELSSTAIFEEKYADEVTLQADLSHEDSSYAIAMDTLNIFKKVGGVGQGSWVLESGVLSSFAGTASLNDVNAVSHRVGVLETADVINRVTALEAFHPETQPMTWTGTIDDSTISQGIGFAVTGLLYSNEDPQPVGTNSIRGFSHPTAPFEDWEWRVLGGSGLLTVSFDRGLVSGIPSATLTSAGPVSLPGIYADITIQARVPGGDWQSSDPFTLTVTSDGSNWEWDPGLPERGLRVGVAMQTIDLLEAGTGDDAPVFSAIFPPQLGWQQNGQFIDCFPTSEGEFILKVRELRSNKTTNRIYNILPAVTAEPPPIPLPPIDWPKPGQQPL